MWRAEEAVVRNKQQKGVLVENKPINPPIIIISSSQPVEEESDLLLLLATNL
jgi:hypothetical protein